MPRSVGSRFWFAIAALVVLAAPAAADAGRRVAVLEIKGARTPRLQQAIIRMVKEKHDNLRASTYTAAARRLRAPRMTPKDIKKTCGYLSIDGVIDGTLVADSGQYRLTLRLRSARTGAITWKQALKLNEPKLNDKLAEQLGKRLNAAIAELPGGGKGATDAEQVEAENDEGFVDEPSAPTRMSDEEAAEREAVDDEEPPAKDKSGFTSRSKPSKAKPAKGKDETPARAEADDDEAAEDEVAEDDAAPAAEADDAPTAADAKDVSDDAGKDDDKDDDGPEAVIEDDGEAAGPTDPAASVAVGLSFSQRKLGFNIAAGLDDAPPGYGGGMVPGIFAAGEVYPMALKKSRGAAASIGIGFLVDKVIKLQTTVEDPGGGTVALATSQLKYEVDVRYRHRFGALTAIGLVGYGGLSFTIDKGAAPDGVEVDVPNVKYSSIDPGVILRYDLLARLALIVSAKANLMLKTGEIQKGNQYGVASVFGLDADVGVEYGVTEKIVVAAYGHYQRIAFAFKGQGQLTDRDGDGEPDVGGAADLYVGGYATVGYRF